MNYWRTMYALQGAVLLPCCAAIPTRPESACWIREMRVCLQTRLQVTVFRTL